MRERDKTRWEPRMRFGSGSRKNTYLETSRKFSFQTLDNTYFCRNPWKDENSRINIISTVSVVGVKHWPIW